MESLFTATPPAKEKTAAPKKTLSDDVSLWPKELISALLEQAGYLGQYRIDQTTLDQDEKRGYAYGYYLVSQQGAPDMRPSDMGPNVPETPQTGLRIPFIVEKKKLKALSTFINLADGKFYPLSQRRVDGILYTPDTFSVAGSTAVGSPTLSGSGMYPETPGEGIQKAASLCSVVGRTISPARKEKIAAVVSADPTLLHGIEHNDAFRTHLVGFMKAKSASASSIAASVKANLPTDAILLEKTADGYMFTSACTRAYFPDSKELTGKAQTALPPELRKEADAKGYSIRIRNLAMPPEESNPPQKVKTSGAYNIQTSSAQVEPALVFTHVRDLDGNAVDGVLVKTASGYAYAEEVFGTPTDNVPPTLTDLTWQEMPRGAGFFVKEGSAGAVASVPVDIKFYEESDGTYAHYESGMSSGKIHVTEGVPHDAGVVKLASGLYAANPRTLVSFMPLGKKASLAGTEDLAVKLASANLRGSELNITHSGGEYTLDGPAVQSLGGAASFIGEPKATFFLGLAGVPPVLGKAKLAEAQVFGRTQVRTHRTIATYEKQQEMAKVAAAQSMPYFPEEDYSLLKIAAALQEESTVDAVLGLNFITPENLAIFADYLPVLEEATAKICELLVAAQLGVSDIPEDAAVRALASMEAITAGLELLQLKSREEVA